MSYYYYYYYNHRRGSQIRVETIFGRKTIDYSACTVTNFKIVRTAPAIYEKLTAETVRVFFFF